MPAIYDDRARLALLLRCRQIGERIGHIEIRIRYAHEMAGVRALPRYYREQV